MNNVSVSIFWREISWNWTQRTCREIVGRKNKKDVIAITINIDTNDSDSDIIIAEDEKHMSNNN